MNQLDILKLMAGHTAQIPIAFDDLVKKSGIEAGVLLGDLQRLFNSQPTPINCAQITKSGKTYMVYWPTGAIAVRIGPQSIVINAAKAEAAGYRGAAAVQPKSNQKEITMTTHSQPRKPKHNPVGELLLKLIGEVPNQTCQALREQVLVKFPQATEKSINKKIWDMANAKGKMLIVKEGFADKATYRLPNATIKAPVALAKAEAAAASTATEKPTIKHVAAPIKSEPLPHIALRARLPEKFECLLSDENVLQIRKGNAFLILNRDEFMRVFAFIGKTDMAAARALGAAK